MKLFRKCLLALSAVFLLTACGERMIGPRSESAWKEYEKEQAALKEKWGNTEVYAYVQKLIDDIHKVNAGVVFQEGFSTETESPELAALRTLQEDMNGSENLSLEEFRTRLEASTLRYAIGDQVELASIEEKGNGEYAVRLEYYGSVDSLMMVNLTVKEENGTFRTELP